MNIQVLVVLPAKFLQLLLVQCTPVLEYGTSTRALRVCIGHWHEYVTYYVVLQAVLHYCYVILVPFSILPGTTGRSWSARYYRIL